MVAPLDWGLGHATRCVPLIRELLDLNYEVIIAAEKAPAALLKAEFPTLTFLALKGYEITYSRSGGSMALVIALQLPKILRQIKYEQAWLKKIVAEHDIDIIISDNRPGLYHKNIPCFYITHQLQIPAGNIFFRWLAKRMHYRYINKFSACLVPDAAENTDLAGSLSHPQKMPLVPVHYMGPLSRFEIVPVQKKYDLLVLLSGPEPQRSIFEENLLCQLKNYSGSCLFVRGLPGQSTKILFENSNVELTDHLPAAALNVAILQAQMIIARSGYTTVMDLVKLKQKAILVATPGQPEQEYLSKLLMQKKIFYTEEQSEFIIEKALEKAALFSYSPVSLDLDNYKKVLTDVLKHL